MRLRLLPSRDCSPILIVLVVLLLLLAPLSGTSSRAADGSKKRIVVIAHRGAHKGVPENTLAALDKAIELGCDFVEIDVRRTKDGALVSSHDASVSRMTGTRGKVEDLTLAEIRKLKVRSRTGDDSGQKIPTLDEIFDHAKGRMKIYVDHKQAPPAEVLAVIEKHGMLADVVVYGSVATLQEYKKLAPSVWIMPSHPRTAEGLEAMAKNLKPEILDSNIRQWTQEEITAAHHAGCQVWVDNLGQFDNPKGFKRSVEMGVDGIQTDDPEVLIRVLKEMGLRGPAAK